ncbi:MAG TPA: cytochrome c3 family protein [Candidatus Binataceae bacterium]|nr:cytochrome c3 family protein [Candidatus Binataceae bacterium]
MVDASGRALSGLAHIARAIAAILLFGVAAAQAGPAQAPVDCLSCHNAQPPAAEAAGAVSFYVNKELFHSSVHSAFGCTACHSDIHGFPHPKPVRQVSCSGCHPQQTSAFAGSIHAAAAAEKKRSFPACLDCHGNPHGVRAMTDPKSRVYPLNLPRTCGSCHGSPELARKYGFPNVYPLYMDSIHGLALTSDGLLVAATCASCHGAHDIADKNDPRSRTFRTNVPATCGKCHAGIQADYRAGVHGAKMAAGDANAPVCTDCHTAHQIAHVDITNWQVKTVATCGNCHKEKLQSYRDTFHGQVTELGFVATARCWSCHGPHKILPASNPQSTVAAPNLSATCSKCHRGVTASFVTYEPHPDARDRQRNPGLYYSANFMNLLLLGVFVFFGVHTQLWLTRSLIRGRKQDPRQPPRF